MYTHTHIFAWPAAMHTRNMRHAIEHVPFAAGLRTEWERYATHVYVECGF